MNRAIVLILCLAGAAGIAVYSHSPAGDQAVVYTVPQRSEPAANPPVTPPPKAIETPGDRVTLIRTLQFELKRVGCYSGEINGVWTTSSRMAMKSFTDEVNASLPIDNPDYILLSLVQQRQGTVCTTTEAKAPLPPSPPPAEKSTTNVGAAVPAAAAAVTALTAATPPPAATPAPDAAKLPPKADDRPRTAATTPPPAEPAPKSVQPSAQPDKAPQTAGGPVPSEGVYEKKPSRNAKRYTQRPPKFVRNVLRALGIR
jgi:hypothetical protein